MQTPRALCVLVLWSAFLGPEESLGTSIDAGHNADISSSAAFCGVYGVRAGTLRSDLCLADRKQTLHFASGRRLLSFKLRNCKNPILRMGLNEDLWRAAEFGDINACKEIPARFEHPHVLFVYQDVLHHESDGHFSQWSRLCALAPKSTAGTQTTATKPLCILLPSRQPQTFFNICCVGPFRLRRG